MLQLTISTSVLGKDGIKLPDALALVRSEYIIRQLVLDKERFRPGRDPALQVLLDALQITLD